jgi:hypothetical protein
MRTGSLRSSEVAKPDFKGREAKRLKYDLVALRGVELRPEVTIENREQIDPTLSRAVVVICTN